MKKTTILAVLMLLPFSAVLAVGGSASQPQKTGAQMQSQGTSVESTVQKESQQGAGQGVQIQDQERIQQNDADQTMTQVKEQVRENTGAVVKAGNAEQLKEMVQTETQKLEQEAGSIKDATTQKVYRNQNTVREAVQSLLAAEDIVGGIGQQVSQIAKDFNNSVSKTIKAEEQIQNRSALTKLFLGGDKTAAAELEQEVNQNRERIQSLNQLMEQCDCDSETKAVLQEQIQNMEQEQNRLKTLAEEQQSNGLFGWLTQLFK